MLRRLWIEVNAQIGDKKNTSFKIKEKIALDLVKHAVESGVNFGYVGTDAGYGKGLTFRKELQRMGVNFVVDIHSDYQIFTNYVTHYLPEKDPSARSPYQNGT